MNKYLVNVFHRTYDVRKQIYYLLVGADTCSVLLVVFWLRILAMIPCVACICGMFRRSTVVFYDSVTCYISAVFACYGNCRLITKLSLNCSISLCSHIWWWLHVVCSIYVLRWCTAKCSVPVVQPLLLAIQSYSLQTWHWKVYSLVSVADHIKQSHWTWWRL